MLGWDPLTNPIAANDLTIEYCVQDGMATQLWCVFRHGQIVFVDARLDPAIDVARTICRAESCAAWLLAGGEPIRVNGPREPTGEPV